METNARDPADAVARIASYVAYNPDTGRMYDHIPHAVYQYTSDNWSIGKETPVAGVIFHGTNDYKTFEIATPEARLFVGDVIASSKGTAIAIEFLIGGRVGIKPGRSIKIINEGEASIEDGGHWTKMVLKSGGLWSKFAKQDKPLTIQTRGGVMGIKG